jgi:hypothetical protein
MLGATMAEEIITPRETFGVAASRFTTVEGGLHGWFFAVFSLVSAQVFWVEEALSAEHARVWPFTVVQVDLQVAADRSISTC